MNSFILLGSVIAGSIILLASLLVFINKNYIRIPPNKAAVIFGRKKITRNPDGSKIEKGYRVVNGGGVFRIPILEEVQYMNLSNRMLNVRVENAPNSDGVMTTVEGVANVKFSSEMNLLRVAVERFLGRNDTDINQIILQNLEGHLRAVVGKMTMEDLIGDKTKLNQAVLEEANDDFNKMGINIDFLNIQDIRDNDNYIKNLGRKRAAEIKRDADIGTAEAERDAVIKTTTAERAGIEEANANKIKIAESNKVRDVRTAEMKALTDTQIEIANQAAPLSEAQSLEAVVKARAATDAANEKANIAVHEQKAEKEKKRYYGEVVVPAEAKKAAQVVDAEAFRESSIIKAEGQKLSVQKIAEGEAEAIRVKKIAEADGEAAYIMKIGEAEGKAIYSKLSAEAKGVKEKAEAYAKLDQTGKFLEILKVFENVGPGLIKEFAGVMAASTAHLGNVKDIKIVDFGGGKDGQTTVGKFGSIPTEILSKFVESLSATGVDPSKLLSFIGLTSENLKDLAKNPKEFEKPE